MNPISKFNLLEERSGDFVVSAKADPSSHHSSKQSYSAKERVSSFDLAADKEEETNPKVPPVPQNFHTHFWRFRSSRQSLLFRITPNILKMPGKQRDQTACTLQS